MANSTHKMSLLKQTLADLKTARLIPSSKLGQNFLIDSNIVDKLLAIAKVQSGDHVVEIGPGLGAISEKILYSGAQLFAVEIDKKICQLLNSKFSDQKNFHLLCTDAVKFPTGNFINTENFKLISNLPYAISSPWMNSLLNCNALPQTITLIVQTETEKRYFAKPSSSSFCPISIFLQSAYDAVFHDNVSAAAFYPSPSVSSKIISMRKKNRPFIFNNHTKKIIRKIFTKRRKQMQGIIKKEFPNLLPWLHENNASPADRPEDLSIQQWQTLNDVV